jgi:hypothetical protein
VLREMEQSKSAAREQGQPAEMTTESNVSVG